MSRKDELLSELASHLTGFEGQRLQQELSKCKKLSRRFQSVLPLRSELEARFWQQISICTDHSHTERAEHLQRVSDEVLEQVDQQPQWFVAAISFLLELSPSPLEFEHVERRRPFEEILEEVSFHDSLVVQQGVPGALGDSDCWSSADSIDEDVDPDEVGSVLTDADFLPPTEQDMVDIGPRDLIPFYAIKDENTRLAFQKLRGGSSKGVEALPRPIQKFHERMSYLQNWLSRSTTGRSLTYQAFAEGISEEVNSIRKELANIERLPNLTMLRLLHLIQGPIETELIKLCHICESIKSQPEPWLEAVGVLSDLSTERFLLKAAKPMLLQIRDLLLKGEFHEELPLDKSPQGSVIVRGPLPENMIIHSFIDKIKMSAYCAYCYKENTGKPLIDSRANLEALDIIGRMDFLLKRNIPVQRAAEVAIIPLCRLVDSVLGEKLKNDYDTFEVLRRYQCHSFFVSSEMHMLAECVFEKRCRREAAEIDRYLEDIVGPEWKVRSIEPFVIRDMYSWPYTIFTCFGDKYVRVRTYIFRVKEAAHALTHWNAKDLRPQIRIARFKLLCVMDLLNQHITLTALECIADADLASGQGIEDISRKHAEWFEKAQTRTLMHPKAVRNTLDELAQISLKFIAEQNLGFIEKKFLPSLGFLAKAIGETLPLLAERLMSAKAHF